MTLTNLVVIQRRFQSARDKTAIFWATNHVTIRDVNQPVLDRYIKMLRRCHFLQSLINQALSEHGKAEPTKKQLNDDFDE